MFRDLPSGIKRLPRSLSNIFVQGTEYVLPSSSCPRTKTKIQIGVASCTNARSVFVGEAWAVGDERSGSVQVGVLDSRENRAFDSLNSEALASQRNWSDLCLRNFEREGKDNNNNNSSSSHRQQFCFAGYTRGRGAFTAVTPASLVASKLASQFLHQCHKSSVSPYSASPSSSSVAPASFRSLTGTDDADASFTSFSADFFLKEELAKAAKWENQRQQQDGSCSKTQASSTRSSPLQSGCRGTWANVSLVHNKNSSMQLQTQQQRPLIKLEVHNVGDARALVIHSKTKKLGEQTQQLRSPALKRLQNLGKQLPISFEDQEGKPRQVDNMGLPIQADASPPSSPPSSCSISASYEEAISDQRQDAPAPSAMHHKLLPRRLRTDPVTNDHRPLRPEEARRIGRAAFLEEDEDDSEMNNSTKRDRRSPSSSSSSPSAPPTTNSNLRPVVPGSGSTDISRDIITPDEFLRGDFAVNVSRAFGHFHFKNCRHVSPDEQMLTCRPETVMRYLEPGDVLVLGNKAFYTGSIPGQRFVGGWSVTLDSVAAHIIDELDSAPPPPPSSSSPSCSSLEKSKTPSVHDVARDLVQLALLSGAEHNVSVVVLRVVAEGDEQEDDSVSGNEMEMRRRKAAASSPFVEYAVPGEVHPFLTQQEHYSQALRRDVWRLGFSTVGRFAQARGEVLADRYSQLQDTLKKHGGSKERPSTECPLSLWAGGLTRDVCSPALLTTHPLAVANMIRELQAEMDWCEQEAKRQ